MCCIHRSNKNGFCYMIISPRNLGQIILTWLYGKKTWKLRLHLTAAFFSIFSKHWALTFHRPLFVRTLTKILTRKGTQLIRFMNSSWLKIWFRVTPPRSGSSKFDRNSTTMPLLHLALTNMYPIMVTVCLTILTPFRCHWTTWIENLWITVVWLAISRKKVITRKRWKQKVGCLVSPLTSSPSPFLPDYHQGKFSTCDGGY